MAAYTTDPSAPAPSPWIARPTMTCGMPDATPETSIPSEKSTTPMASARPGPRRSASEPASVIPMMFVSQKALKAQPYRSSPPRSSTSAGSTVGTAIPSNAAAVTRPMRPAVRTRRPGAQVPSVTR